MSDAFEQPEVGSPEFWLHRLSYQLLVRQFEFSLRKAYAEGNAEIPGIDPRYQKALKQVKWISRTNYCGLVNSAPVERMTVRGFRFGAVGEADSDAQRFWRANDMDYQALLIHNRAAKYGLAYSLVAPAGHDDLAPIITAEDPRQCIVYRDPLRPSKYLAGLKMWVDDLLQQVLAIVYLPGGSYGFAGPSAKSLQEHYNPDQCMGVLFHSTSGFQPAGFQANTIGQIPLTEYVWRPDSGDLPEAEAGADVREIQDRINHEILMKLIIMHNQAYRQRWMSGAEIPKGKKGDRKPPFDPGADTLWVTANENVKFGEFDTADITQILDSIRDEVADLASISKTPPHYLMGRLANVSGDTLTQAESGLTSKVKTRMTATGWGHERTMRLCFLYEGNTAKATDTEAQTLWNDPEQHTTAELADAAVKWQQAGIPLELIMDRLNFEPDEVKFGIEKQKEQQALDQQQAAQDHQNQLELTQAKPSTAPGGPAK